MSIAPCPGGMDEETETQRCSSAMLLLEWLFYPYNMTRWTMVLFGVPLPWLLGLCPLWRGKEVLFPFPREVVARGYKEVAQQELCALLCCVVLCACAALREGATACQGTCGAVERAQTGLGTAGRWRWSLSTPCSGEETQRPTVWDVEGGRPVVITWPFWSTPWTGCHTERWGHLASHSQAGVWGAFPQKH